MIGNNADMNKKDLISIVSNECKICEKLGRKIINSVFENIAKSMLRGEIVLISGFGKFWAKYCSATLKTLPITSFKREIPPKFVPKFRATQALKRRFWLNFD